MTSVICSAVVFQPLITAITLLSILSSMPDDATARAASGQEPASRPATVSTDRDYTFALQGLDHVRLDLHAADVVLSGSPSGAIEVSLRELHVSDRCRVRVEQEDRTLVIESKLQPSIGRCELEVEVALPPSLGVTADVGAGDVHLDDLGTDLALSTGAGDVHGSVHGHQVRISTGAGDVDLHGLRAAISASTGTGDLSLRFAYAPTGTIEASTGVGDVEVHLPPDAVVQAEASTGLGDVRQSLASRSGAPTVVRASSGLGDVTVD